MSLEHERCAQRVTGEVSARVGDSERDVSQNDRVCRTRVEVICDGSDNFITHKITSKDRAAFAFV